MPSVFDPSGTLTLPHNFVQQAEGADPKIYADDVDEQFNTVKAGIEETRNGAAEKVQNLGSVSDTLTIDVSAGPVIIATISGATIFIFTGAINGRANTILLKLTNGGSAVVTWPLGVRWPGGTAPALTKFGVDLVILTTSDGGSTWMGTANIGYAE